MGGGGWFKLENAKKTLKVKGKGGGTYHCNFPVPIIRFVPDSVGMNKKIQKVSIKKEKTTNKSRRQNSL
jgi:hypothetical protein